MSRNCVWISSSRQTNIGQTKIGEQGILCT
ncbi:hypothetical protein MTR67_000753 [Solanum verrucosum]|uniref:Uncharacterized protein n=1 Tax=Solanum verrucosum TaxID=315347 RepID=A0AAF0PM80_SOLVR|nr:hypothetical protein MTR67_000753 [Solanum verrucosum]